MTEPARYGFAQYGIDVYSEPVVVEPDDQPAVPQPRRRERIRPIAGRGDIRIGPPLVRGYGVIDNATVEDDDAIAALLLV